jgi:hypothetical protein
MADVQTSRSQRSSPFSASFFRAATAGIGDGGCAFPTCDRPVGFRLAEVWMQRQTRPPDEWIVADGGHRPARCTLGQTHLHAPAPPGPRNFLTNLARGVDAATGDIVVFIEDDDQYAAGHLAALVQLLADAPEALLAGDSQPRYYHLPRRCWRTLEPAGASLCQTAVRRAGLPAVHDAIRICVRAASYEVDARLWELVPPAARVRAPLGTSVGMKGLPGQPGLGIGHRPDHRWTADPARETLAQWIGADVACYDQAWKGAA